jgi:hypothetical protein
MCIKSRYIRLLEDTGWVCTYVEHGINAVIAPNRRRSLGPSGGCDKRQTRDGLAEKYEA